MSKIKIVTAIYTRLGGTKFGGRGNRTYHYVLSLKSLMKMSDAEFIIYTSEEEKEMYELEFQDYTNKKILVHDLENSFFQKTLEKYKNYEESKSSDRCVEIQYLKFQWLRENNYDCDYIYWIDCGLSHVALIPNKWLTYKDRHRELKDYYYSDLFDNNLLHNLVSTTGDKIFLIAKENRRNPWAHQPLEMFNEEYDYAWHIIGGLFGGKSSLVEDYCSMYYDYAIRTAETCNKIWYEENIMTVIFYNHKDKFIPQYFDVWMHEDNTKPEYIGGMEVEEYLKINKAFYKILEQIYYKK